MLEKQRRKLLAGLLLSVGRGVVVLIGDIILVAESVKTSTLICVVATMCWYVLLSAPWSPTFNEMPTPGTVKC